MKKVYTFRVAIDRAEGARRATGEVLASLGRVLL